MPQELHWLALGSVITGAIGLALCVYAWVKR